MLTTQVGWGGWLFLVFLILALASFLLVIIRIAPDAWSTFVVGRDGMKSDSHGKSTEKKFDIEKPMIRSIVLMLFCWLAYLLL